MAILTTARQAVWTAIEAWSYFDGFWKRKYKFEDRPGKAAGEGEDLPTIGDLPALAIQPQPVTTEWTLNQFQEIRYPLLMTWWTREWDVRKSEEIWEEIIKAIHQEYANGANANRIVNFSAPTMNLVELGEDGTQGGNATRTSFLMTHRVGYWNPRTAS